MQLFDGGTIAWIVGAVIALAVAGGVVGFVLWYTGDDQDVI